MIDLAWPTAMSIQPRKTVRPVIPASDPDYQIPIITHDPGIFPGMPTPFGHPPPERASGGIVGEQFPKPFCCQHFIPLE
jgi:hypothetical protein